MLQAQGQTIPKPPVDGLHRCAARVQLVETLKALGNQEAAKRNVEHARPPRQRKSKLIEPPAKFLRECADDLGNFF